MIQQEQSFHRSVARTSKAARQQAGGDCREGRALPRRYGSEHDRRESVCASRARQGIQVGAWLLLLLLSAAFAGHAQTLTAEETNFFESKVRPLLIAQCYSCHGERASQGGLRLDSRDAARKGGEHGAAFIAGKPEQSLLIRAVQYTDKTLQMPPRGRLSDAQIAVLIEWVKRGAPDPRTAAPASSGGRVIDIAAGRRHWAFQPLKSVTPPAPTNAARSKNPIDRFILAKLQSKGLKPNPYADRRTLIRRATFDMLGLPPTPQEVQAFLEDRSPNAWEKVVDRLLASPHYGERWARHWLDLARYADSHGYEQDYDRPYAYAYRDFVIKALNADLPYNQFIQWQLAGDEIDPENPLALAATGFLGAGVHSTQITKNQVEKERYDELDDMLSTTGTSMLGLSVGCARCHNHKYDPIPNRDYYRLLSTFTTTVRSDMDVNIDPAGYRRAKAAFDTAHAPLTEALRKFETEDMPRRFAQWLRSPEARKPIDGWNTLAFTSAKSEGGATLTSQPDGSLLASGTNPDFDTYTFVATTHLTRLTAVRLEALAHPSFVKGGPGRAGNGNFALTDFRITAAPLGGQGKLVEVKLIRPRATFQQAGLPIAATIDADPKSAWAIDPQFGKDHAAAFELETPVGFAGGTVLTFTLKFANNNQHSIGRPRLSVTAAAPDLALNAPGRPERVAALLADPQLDPAALAPADRDLLLGWARTLDPEWQRLNTQVQAHLAQAPQPSIQKMMICSEGVTAIRTHTQGGDFLEQTHFLRRGDPGQKEGVATPSFLQVLMPAPDAESHWQMTPPPGSRTSYRRRALANWMTDTQEGAGALLARVGVNRLWQHHFGLGIVGTPSDFGTQGDRPSNPELLEWLASELVRNGWRLKPLHRLMLTSATYMQSAADNPLQSRADPQNRLCWRFSRHRLEAEAVRDALLAVSGELEPTMFGPGTLDENMKRRSLYFTVKRSRLIPTLMIFDAPDALLSLPVRSSTTIAPQALLLMNNDHVREYARALAHRLSPTPGTPLPDAITNGYLLTLSRAPSSEEMADTLTFLRTQTASYRASGQSKPDELALIDLSQVLLGLNEFLYIE
jgi:mono/diheme cytochrome c family protein